MTKINVGDRIFWIADDESTQCVGEVTYVDDEDLHVLVDERFWSIEEENMNPDHEVLLSIDDFAGFEEE